MSGIGFFYLNVEYHGQQAVIQLTDEAYKTWRLMNPQHTAWWPQEPGWWKGVWRKEYGTVTHIIECLHEATKGVIFKLQDVSFPPDIDGAHRFFIGNDWVKGGGPNTVGAWRPIITDALLAATVRKFEEIEKELLYLMGQLGCAIPEPTGLLPTAGAAMALRHGDYVGCAANLLGVIPLIGKAANVARGAGVAARLEALAAKLRSLREAVLASAQAAKRANLQGKVINADIQGAKAANAATKATTGQELFAASRNGGMELRDAEAMQGCAIKNNAVIIVRQSAPQSMARHGDILNTGKPCELADFHTANGGAFDGYIVVRRDQLAMHTKIDPKTGDLVLKNHPEYIVQKWADEKGNRLITKNGEAYYSDYDFQGIYHVQNGKPYLDFKYKNDDQSIIRWMNRMMPGHGEKMRHGFQDFWRKIKVTSGGDKRVMPGRFPTENEKFLVFEPNGKVSNVNLKELYFLYRRYGIAWPYKTPL